MRRLALLAPLAIAACSLMLGEGFTGEDAPAVDGGEDTGASTTDAANDSAAQGGGDADANETGGDPDAGAAFCKTKMGALYCQDFDDVALANLVLAKKAGDVSLDGTTFVSPGRSLHTTTTATTSDFAQAALFAQLGTAGTTLRVELDFRAGANGADYTEIFSLRSYTSDTKDCSVTLTMRGSPNWCLYAKCAGGTVYDTCLAPVEFGKWVHATVDIDTVTTNGSVTFGTSTEKFQMGSEFVNGNLTLYVGVSFAKMGSTFTEVSLDNLLVTK